MVMTSRGFGSVSRSLYWKPHQAAALLPKARPAKAGFRQPRGFTSMIRTASTSPGSASRTKITPVRPSAPAIPPPWVCSWRDPRILVTHAVDVATLVTRIAHLLVPLWLLTGTAEQSLRECSYVRASRPLKSPGARAFSQSEREHARAKAERCPANDPQFSSKRNIFAAFSEVILRRSASDTPSNILARDRGERGQGA